ncbi:nuclease-related domain-containing protein [Dermatobacter hominis]|uniref:nuclease-related domain-containing protein n=1 Tax=Dermatobacter hominis TaxID=2884263 RepID=UPI001D12518C|nr:nuclease-related domain-containing protein [Dermatobacter hominis]UDY35326.1 NERD domain-containing protein [Dermatobacter hominis]
MDRRQLRSIVADLTDRRATVLDDVELPSCRTDVDHVVVAPNGVWIVDVMACTGSVELREVGGFFRTEHRLHVDGRDRTTALDTLVWQRAAVDELLGRELPTAAGTPVHTALVLLDGDRDVPDAPLQVDDHRVCSRSDLGELVAGPGPLSVDAVAAIVEVLRAEQGGRDAIDLTDRARPVVGADAVRALLG